MKTKSKKKSATPEPEPDPKPSKDKKDKKDKKGKKDKNKSPSQPPPPVQTSVNGSSTTAVKQGDPVQATKSAIPDEADFNLPSHTPSYVGISCAILGYGLYNRYNGSPGPSLDVSSLQNTRTSQQPQASDEVDTTGPVNRMIAQFERLKKEQQEKAAEEYRMNRPVSGLSNDQGSLLPGSTPTGDGSVRKFPPVTISDTKNRPDEKTLEEKIQKHLDKQIVLEEHGTPSRVEKYVEERQVQSRNEERKSLEQPRVVKPEPVVPVKESKVRQELFKQEEQVKRNDDRTESPVQVAVVQSNLVRESKVNERREETVVSTRQEIEHVAIEEHVVSEEEDVSIEMKSDRHQKHVLVSPSPDLMEDDESDTGSVRIHETPEPSERSQGEQSFEAFVLQQEQPQASPSPQQLTSPSPPSQLSDSRSIEMKHEFPVNAQIVEQNEEEVDELSTQVQVSDSNEGVRETQIGSTSSRKTSIESDDSAEGLVRDGKWFLSQYELVCDEVGRKITQAESDLDSYSNQMSDDVEGRIRAGVGKAHLLINSKLKQFHDLCINNIENTATDGFETKIEDLEGFWEMVSYQIEDVHQTFDEIDAMKKNSWQPVPELPRPETLLPKSKSRAKKGSSSSVTPEDEEAAAAKEEARKARLREAKRIQAERLAATQQDDVLIFAPPTAEQTTPSPVASETIVSATETTIETQELITIESSTISGEQNTSPAPPKESDVLVDLLS